jgi:hypothetical protein
MPFLGDYLGHLLSEITMARVQADLEAVRVAELYASHPLLKNMAVPRFRLPTITLDVPVSVASMEEAKAGESPRGGVALPVLRERFGMLLGQQLERAKIELSDAERATLDQALDRSVADAAVPPYLASSSVHMADDLVATVIRILGASRPTSTSEGPPVLETLADDLGAAARQAFLGLRAEPPRLHVLVTTAELREAPKELLAQLHLSISEEAFEWSLSESPGRARSKLVPE